MFILSSSSQLKLSLLMYYRALSTSACQSFGPLLWGEVASVRSHWLFIEG